MLFTALLTPVNIYQFANYLQKTIKKQGFINNLAFEYEKLCV